MMRLLFSLLLLCCCINAQGVLHIVSIKDPTFFVIPPVSKPGENSSHLVKLSLPGGTVSLIYAISTYLPGATADNCRGLNLFQQVKVAAGPVIDSTTMLELGAKVKAGNTDGSVNCYVLHSRADNILNFRNSKPFNFVKGCSRANFNGGAVSLGLEDNGLESTLFVGIQNPSINDSAIVVFEAVAIVDSYDPLPAGGVLPDQMFEFPGNVNEFLSSTLQYPEDAREHGYQARLDVTFIIDTNGKVDSVNVIKRRGHGFDEEAIRTVKQMPPWKPAKKDGLSLIHI